MVNEWLINVCDVSYVDFWWLHNFDKYPPVNGYLTALLRFVPPAENPPIVMAMAILCWTSNQSLLTNSEPLLTLIDHCEPMLILLRHC